MDEIIVQASDTRSTIKKQPEDILNNEKKKLSIFNKMFKSVSCSALLQTKYLEPARNKAHRRRYVLFKPIRRSFSYSDLPVHKNYTNRNFAKYNFFHISYRCLVYDHLIEKSDSLPTIAETQTDLSLCPNVMIDSVVCKENIFNKQQLLEAGDLVLYSEKLNEVKNKSDLEMPISSTNYEDINKIKENILQKIQYKENKLCNHCPKESIMKAFAEFDKHLIVVKDQLEGIQKSIEKLNEELLLSDLEEETFV